MIVEMGLQQPAHFRIPPAITFSTKGAVGTGMLGFGAFLMTTVVSFIASDVSCSSWWPQPVDSELGVTNEAPLFLEAPFAPTFFGAVEVDSLVKLLPEN